MGLLRFSVGSRSHMIEAIGGLCAASPANQGILDQALKNLDRTKRIQREEFWELEKDPDLRLRVESLQSKIDYCFLKPWNAKQAVHHSSLNPTDSRVVYRNGRIVDYSCFKAMAFQGDEVLKRAARWALCNTGPSPSSTPKYGGFIYDKHRAVSSILDTSLSNDFLARVAARLDLWTILNYSVDKVVEQEVSVFLEAVADGRFDIPAPKMLASAVQALAGSVYVDTGSIEVFRKVWEDLFFFEDNPVYVLAVTPRKDDAFILPFFQGDCNDRWKLFDITDDAKPRLLGSGISKLEAAYEANKLNG